MARGTLRIYLGAAPGVGKTYAMLGEAHRRLERGGDVVVGFVETHDRPRTKVMLAGLEQVPRREIEYRGGVFTEMDVDAVLARNPGTALVDELAHSNIPGSRNAKRWQDIEELLSAGINVVSTVNIQHLESLNDVVESITGVVQKETVPDEVVRRADQIELVDMSPEALRRRLAHGNIYLPDKVDAALSQYFRVGNLAALRELALLWTADRVDEHLKKYRDDRGITGTWPARERVVVGLTGGPEGETLLRRGARMAARGAGGELMAVHITGGDALSAGASPARLARQSRLTEELGGSYHSVIGDDIPTALLEFARGVNATQIVLGSSRRKPWEYIFGPGVGATVARLSGEVDVHIVTHEYAGKGYALPRFRKVGLGMPRTVAGWIVGVGLPIALTPLLTTFHKGFSSATDMLLYLACTVAAALLGGLFPSLASAIVGSLLWNWYFTAPYHTLTIQQPDNMVALAIFVATALAVAWVVDLAARRTAQAARSRAESETLSLLANSVLRGEQALPALLERVRETFAVDSVALLERADDRSPWVCVDAVGDVPACERPEDADVEIPVNDDLSLVLRGRVLPAEDRRVLGAFAAQAAVVLERQRLVDEAASARRQAEGNKIRTALLAAVSHDLRTPLAGIKASVTSLRSQDVSWSPEDEAELLAGIEEGADRLDNLVGNLLDMSRLHTDTLTPLMADVSLDEVVPAALRGLPPGRVTLEFAESLPAVRADAGLLERVVANVVENAVKYGAAEERPVRVRADVVGDRLELRVVDHGPGVGDDDKEQVFEPFQRLGDAPRGAGVGLGLAVARGFAEAMDGALQAEDTPGGGLTMVLSLRTADGAAQVGRDAVSTAEGAVT
ncbi:histidine kinase [Mangrovactinospora gilvigrisea]|uniref:histidine kinase n=1 Tax=Mangrovactinospora gilvigrisea TaxID=1428644 RepID=A0A1J7BX88_9ACTN|nr:DUF4118 domain-containing protein [Mangrovactinospora gilvigrisea]OIV38097.1 histidine kinase [Mangrovactinospora gilvigrisea]